MFKFSPNERHEPEVGRQSRGQKMLLALAIAATTAGLIKFIADYSSEYLNESEPSLIALDARTGKISWSVALADRLPPTKSTILYSRHSLAAGNRVFVPLRTKGDFNSVPQK